MPSGKVIRILVPGSSVRSSGNMAVFASAIRQYCSASPKYRYARLSKRSPSTTVCSSSKSKLLGSGKKRRSRNEICFPDSRSWWSDFNPWYRLEGGKSDGSKEPENGKGCWPVILATWLPLKVRFMRGFLRFLEC